MRHAELAELEKRAAELAKGSALGGRVRKVTVEADEGEETGDFLTVQIEIEDIDALPLDEMKRLMQSIEEALAPMDDRFPSVRFADAA